MIPIWARSPTRTSGSPTCPVPPGQPHTRYEAGHFIQEEVGEEMAAHVVLFMQANPLNQSRA